MKVVYLSSSLSKKGGGVTEVKRRLAQNLLAVTNINIEVFGLKDSETENDMKLWEPLTPKSFHATGPSAIGFSTKLLSELRNSDADLIHLHGLWQYPSYAARRSHKPYISTIHGMLEPWALNNSKLKKTVAAGLYEKAALRKAKCLHAITQQEVRDIRSFGLRNPVCFIPNGVDIPSDIGALRLSKPSWSASVGEGKKVLLYLGRIHPKKGLINLIKAWEIARAEKINGYADWNLVIAGWAQGGHEDQLKGLVKELRIEESVHFAGPQFNKNRLLSYAHADGFILPSYSEGLPMVVLEAWAFGLPVLMTKECNLPEGFHCNAALEIEPSEKSILNTLRDFFSKREIELAAMGQAGNQLVREKFSWKLIAEQMLHVYNWMLGDGPTPETVIMAKSK